MVAASSVSADAHCADRLAIADIVRRFSRGVDRRDWDLVRSCYHEDAVDEHGVYSGSASGFVDWLAERRSGSERVVQHTISNVLIEVAGDRAAGEIYFEQRTTGVDGEYAHSFGRYIDRYERREGRWAIVHRLCVMEWVSKNQDYDTTVFVQGSQDGSDPSYAAFEWANSAPKPPVVHQ